MTASKPTEKMPTGWFIYHCGECEETWRSVHGHETVLQTRGYGGQAGRDMESACPRCGVPARNVTCKTEYTEASGWRERWPKLPKGVSVLWYSKVGYPPRFKAMYKGQYLGLFPLIEEAVTAVEWAKQKWEDKSHETKD